MIVTLAMLAAVPCGSTVSLERGSYPLIQISNRDCAANPITIIASGSKIERLRLTNVKGIVWRSGAFSGAMGSGAAGYAVAITNSDGVKLDRLHVNFSQRGVVISGSQNVEVTRSVFTRLIIDGVNIASSHKVRVAGNSFTAFDSGEAHPDAVQGWSLPTGKPTSDIVVEDNMIEGRMQGIFFGNHVRGGIDDGGFDRVTVRRNRVKTSFPNGIALYDCRGCAVESNSVATLAPSRFWTRIVVTRGSVRQSGNVVAPRPARAGE
jgi:hypothetical protein